MEKRRKILYILCMVFVFQLLYHPISLKAAYVITPHILSTANDADYKKEKIQEIYSDGNELITIRVEKKGAVRIRIAKENGGMVVAEIYRKADASDLPRYIKADCSSDIWNTGYLMSYYDKGNYYIRLPKGTYQIGAVAYVHGNSTLKNNMTVGAYCDYAHANTYTFKAPKDGYIMVSKTDMEKTEGTMTAQLYNAKGKALTKSYVFSPAQGDVVSYAVKKGSTYKLKIRALNVNDQQYYQLKLKFVSVKEKSGADRKNAVTIKMGNKVSGIALAEEKKSKADWYKFKNARKQELWINYAGNVTSGNLQFDIYDSKMHKLDSYTVIANIKDEKTDSLHNAKRGLKMPAGTYYIRITKSVKTATGSYMFRVMEY